MATNATIEKFKQQVTDMIVKANNIGPKEFITKPAFAVEG